MKLATDRSSKCAPCSVLLIDDGLDLEIGPVNWNTEIVIRQNTCPVKQWRTQEFFSGGSTNSVEDRGQRERGSGGGSPLVRGSGGSCSLVQGISFHIVKFSQFLVL